MKEITINGATYDGSPLPSADYIRLTGEFNVIVDCGEATIGTLDCGLSTITWLYCNVSTIDLLDCKSAKIDRLNCGSATIIRLDCDSSGIERLFCRFSKIERLDCGDAKIDYMNCGSSRIHSMDCGFATISTLYSESATINGASTAATPETIRWAKRLVADIESGQLRLNMRRWHGWEKRPKNPDGYCNTVHCIAGAIQCCLGDWKSEPANVLRREAPGLAWLMYTSNDMALRELRRIAALKF